MAAQRVWCCERWLEAGMTASEFRQLRAIYAQRTIPELIELLSSAELRVCFCAEMALRDATST